MSNDGATVPDAALGAEICRALREQVGKLGLDIGAEPVWEQAVFRSRTDPYSGEISLAGTWSGGNRYGTVDLLPDGRVFAEYQVLLPSLRNPGQYVEAVQVWGYPGALKGGSVLAAWNPE